MKRFTYGINTQTTTSGLMGQVQPINVQEVVPGDTLSGVMNVSVQSATTTAYIKNRAYYDVYSFYAPYRILWGGFPEFISGRPITDPEPTLPLVTDLFAACFEKEFTVKPVVGFMTALVPWVRRIYNQVIFRYFAGNEAQPVAPDSTVVAPATYRPGSFLQSTIRVGDISNTIDTSGPTLDVDDIRSAFAQDQFDKVRRYYGDKYVDYLRALGIKTSWTILEEPEFLGKTSGRLKYQIQPATAETASGAPLGTIGGYFHSEVNHRFGKKFFPEHGVVLTVCVVRIDQFLGNATHTIGANDLVEHYWSPERDAVKVREYPDAIFVGTAAGAELTQSLPNFEHLRKGISLPASTSAQANAYNWLSTVTDPLDLVFPNAADWIAAFVADLGKIPGPIVQDAQFAYTVYTKLTKQSPVGTCTQAPLR